jgi:hypothetical protein
MTGLVYEGVLGVHRQEMRAKILEEKFLLCCKAEKGPW